jgi:hypothetical protein
MDASPRDERLGCAVAFAVAPLIAGVGISGLYDFLAPM